MFRPSFFLCWCGSFSVILLHAELRHDCCEVACVMPVVISNKVNIYDEIDMSDRRIRDVL